jgi:hypothetical protein
MIVDTGYRCPEVQSFGFFPFAVTTDINELVNQSGFSGPIPKLDENRPGLSGVIGDGTFYPASVNLDSLSRLFWCVKDYSVQIRLSKISFGSLIQCNALAFPDLYPPISAYVYCGIGTFHGAGARLDNGDIDVKVMAVQDYCSHGSNSKLFNVNRQGQCPTDLNAKTSAPNKNICCPINPPQKFNDLLCRKDYLTWAPKQEEWQHFNIGNYTAIKSPFFSYWTQFRVTEPLVLPPYECNYPSLYYDNVASMFTFSLMNGDALAYSGNSTRYVSQNYIPPYSEAVSPLDCLGKSGEALTNEWGEITGYGINPKPSGLHIPPLFFYGTGTPEYPMTGLNKGSYFPFTHFQMRLRNQAEGLAAQCPVNEVITSIMPRKGAQSVGVVKIMDFISGSSRDADNFTTIMQFPLYTASNLSQNQLQIEVMIRPGALWVSSSGTPTY